MDQNGQNHRNQATRSFVQPDDPHMLLEEFALPPVDPTRSTDRFDSLLNGRKKKCEKKMWVDFRVLEIRPQGGTILLWSRHLLLFLFLNGENQVRTKNPNDSSMEKKRSAKTRFLGPGIRLPIGKVTHMR